MSTAVKEIDRSDYSQLDYMYGLLSELSDEELKAVQTVVIAFINKRVKNRSGSKVTPFQPQTEEQLFNRIDHSLAQIDRGNYTDSEQFEEEMLAGIPE